MHRIRILAAFLPCLVLGVLSLHAQCPITVNAGPDKFVCAAGSTVELEGSVSGAYLGLRWTPATGLNSTSILNPTATVNGTVTYTLTGAAEDPSAPNLVSNPGFESGNTGFTSGYAYNALPTTPGTYVLTTSPALVLSAFPPCDDHTFGNGTGYMMLCNGNGGASTQVWCQSIPVTANSWYTLRAWALCSPISPPVFQFKVNNVNVGTPFAAQGLGCVWQEFSATWFSGAATSANFCIFDVNGSGNGLFGDDFALDDIFMAKACTATDQVKVSVVSLNAVAPATATLPCSAAQTGIVLNGNGSSTGPGIEYSWDGPGVVSGGNTLTPTVNETGAYTLTVSFDTGDGVCTKTATVVVLPDPQTVVANATANGLLTCANTTVTLSGLGSSVGGLVSYNWQPASAVVSGNGTLFPVVNQAGEYTLLVTHTLSGCTATATVVVNQNTTPVTAAASVPGTLPCIAGSITLSGAGSTTGSSIQYQWAGPGIVSGGTSLNNCVVNAPGTYTLTVTNNTNGCTAKASVSVTQSGTPPVVVAAANAPGALNCVTPALTLNSTGSSSDSTFTYLWTTTNGHFSGPVNGHTATVDSTGLYVLTITSLQNGCTATDTVVVAADTIRPLAVAAANAPGVLNCSTLSLTLSSAGSSNDSTFAFLWTTPDGHFNGPVDGPTTSVDAVGLYVFTVFSLQNGCTAADTIQVAANTQAPLAMAAANAPGVLNCVTPSLTLNSAGSSNDSTFVFHWTSADGHFSGPVNGQTATADAPGLYVLTISNLQNGCTATATVSLAANTTPPLAVAAADAPGLLNCITPSLTLNSTGSSNDASFAWLWTTSDGHFSGPVNDQTATVDAAGLYVLTVTNLTNGCTASATVQVTANTAAPLAVVAAEAPGVLNCNTSGLTLNSAGSSNAPALTYLWASPDGHFTGPVDEPTASVDAPGLYVLTIGNPQNGCTATAAVPVLWHANVGIVLQSQTNLTCFEAGNGSITIVATGGDSTYTYAWDTGAGTAALNNLAAGTYALTVTDGENCSATVAVTLSQPTALLPQALATPPSAAGVDDGTASANPAGGVGPYTFLWSTGAVTPFIGGLATGLYTVTVTDANGCTAGQTVEVWAGICAVTAAVSAVNPSCTGLADGQVSVAPAGGIPPYSYAWNSGGTASLETGLAAGTHTVTVTDVNGCQATESVALNDPPVLTLAVLEVLPTDCPGQAGGAATVAGSGGTGAINISWSDGQSGPTATGLPDGIYLATATDARGCTDTSTVTIEAIDALAPVLQAGAVTVALGPSGSVTLTLLNLGATASDNCSLSVVEITPHEFDCTGLGVQQVTLTATDQAGNSSSVTIPVTLVDTIPPTLVCPPNVTSCFSDRVVAYIAPVATDNCLGLGGQFALVEGLASGSEFPVGATTNTYTFTDAQGNTGSCSFQVTIRTPLSVVQDSVISDTGNQHSGGVLVSVSGSQPGYTYLWTSNSQPVASTEDLTGVGMGNYTLLVTDAAGCTVQAGPFAVGNVSATDSPDWATRVSIFPNPTTGRLWVEFPPELAGAEMGIAVFDATGRRVLEQYVERQSRVALDLERMAGGLYTLSIRAAGQWWAWKIAVLR